MTRLPETGRYHLTYSIDDTGPVRPGCRARGAAPQLPTTLCSHAHAATSTRLRSPSLAWIAAT